MPHPFASRPSFDKFDENLFDFGSGKDLSEGAISAIRSFVCGLRDDREDSGAIWGVFDKLCSAEYAVLASGTNDEVNALARRLFGSPLSHGFLQGEQAYNALIESPGSRQHVGSIILDRFFRLAEAVGASRVLSAEHGQTVIHLADLDGIMARIEDEIGADLPAPQQDGRLFGLRLRGGIYSDRHFDGIYAAWRTREIAKASGNDAPTVCEIGGGAGHLTYYTRKLGCRSCAIIDLPQAAIVQYLMLASEFGEHRVSLDHPVRDGVELIQAGTPEADQTHRWDVLINVDSIPEMPPSAAERYIANVARGQTFISINQESGIPNGSHTQNVVRDVAARMQLKRSSRYPAWLRSGYVEEVYTRRA